MENGVLNIALLFLLLAAGMLTCTLIYQRNRFRKRLELASNQLEKMQHNFSLFAPRYVVDQLARGEMSRESERREITVLFSDLKNFTAMSDDLPPDTVIYIVRRYMEICSSAITGNRGYVAKYMGDGLMALFGALENNPWKNNDAVSAALEMQEGIKSLNTELAISHLPQIETGIGLNSGQVVLGFIGSSDMQDFTAISRVVNMASRVEKLTRQLPENTLITESVKENLAPRFTTMQMQPMPVKGMHEPLVTYAVKGMQKADKVTLTSQTSQPSQTLQASQGEQASGTSEASPAAPASKPSQKA